MYSYRGLHVYVHSVVWLLIDVSVISVSSMMCDVMWWLMLSVWWESLYKTVNAMKWRMLFRFSKWVAYTDSHHNGH